MDSVLFNIQSFNTFTSSAIHGWCDASSMRFYKYNENSARQGLNRTAATIQQFFQFRTLLTAVSILENSTKVTIPANIKKISEVAIFFIGGACYRLDSATDKNPKLKKVFNLLHDNLGNLCQIASVITSLALFQAGHTVYGSFSLLSFTLNFLISKKIFPAQVERNYLKTISCVELTSGLFSNSWLLKIFATYNIIVPLLRNMKLKTQIPYNTVNHVSNLKDLAMFYKILHCQQLFEVNREHVHIIPFPQTNVRDFSALIDLFNQFQWKDAMSDVKKLYPRIRAGKGIRAVICINKPIMPKDQKIFPSSI